MILDREKHEEEGSDLDDHDINVWNGFKLKKPKLYNHNFLRKVTYD